MDSWVAAEEAAVVVDTPSLAVVAAACTVVVVGTAAVEEGTLIVGDIPYQALRRIAAVAEAYLAA